MTAAGIFLFGVVVGIAFLAICNAWDRRPQQPTHTRPASSSRKAGRVSNGGGWS